MVHRIQSILILGTRGIPAAHGGFETFAEKLSLFLIKRGWHVCVYCQHEVERVEKRFESKIWRGIELINVQVASKGPRATLEFDAHCVRDAASREGICLVLGYNGAAFLPYLRIKGKKIITNMDGIEWRRPKWGIAARTWFWLNEWIAAWISHRLVADHPRIAEHLSTRRSSEAIVMIPYGGEAISEAPVAPVRALGLDPGRYLISIARIEPDNNILTIVEAFGRRPRNAKLVILGQLSESNPYHLAIREAAGKDVVFTGPIYDGEIVRALRYHARAYMHGHTVGGTNPSLVEALAAGNAVVAHDNEYNHWTAGAAGLYFSDAETCDKLMSRVIEDDLLVARRSALARERARQVFQWENILLAYEHEALQQLGIPSGDHATLTPRQQEAEMQ